MLENNEGFEKNNILALLLAGSWASVPCISQWFWKKKKKIHVHVQKALGDCMPKHVSLSHANV